MKPANAWSLDAMTYPEVKALLAGERRTVALIPVGSTEAHGPHLPLSTDSIIAEGMADAASVALIARDLEAVKFPAVHYAVTQWARDFAGSTSLGTETATALFVDAALAADEMGFTRVVLVSAHLEPGHIATLREATRRFQDRTARPLVFPDKTRRKVAEQLGAEFKSGSCHAGSYETSMVLALRPELVRRDLAAELPEHVVPLHEHIRDGAQSFTDCGMDQAYCGAPSQASEAEGKRNLAILGTVIADAVERSFDDAP